MTYQPGDVVTWTDPHPDDPPNECGLVLKPTPSDLAYFREQDYPPDRNVLVMWNDTQWDTAWHNPAELKPIQKEH